MAEQLKDMDEAMRERELADLSKIGSSNTETTGGNDRSTTAYDVNMSADAISKFPKHLRMF